MMLTFLLSDQIYVINGKMTYPGSNKSSFDGSFLRNHKTLAKKKKNFDKYLFFICSPHSRKLNTCKIKMQSPDLSVDWVKTWPFSL